MVKNYTPLLKKFFSEYEERMNKALTDSPEVDVEATANAFADCFIEASPKGVMCGKNDEQFRIQIPKGLEFYRAIGTKAMKIIDLDIHSLDDFHAMVKVYWRAEYKKKDNTKKVIDFDVIYLLQILHSAPKIFAYITGDEEKVLQDKGLIPST